MLTLNNDNDNVLSGDNQQSAQSKVQMCLYWTVQSHDDPIRQYLISTYLFARLVGHSVLI